MKAARFYGGKDIRVETVPDPEPGPGQVLVRVRAAGICGSDLHGYRAPNPQASAAPRTSGHELAGEVVGLGRGVKSLKVGDRVGVEPLIGCGECEHCGWGQYHLCAKLEHIGGARSGGFAELTVAPEEKAYLLPEHVSYDEASILDVLAVAVHALTIVPVEPAERVVVVGTGAIGLSIANMAALAGASVAVVGRRQGPLDVAAEIAGAYGVDSSQVDPVEAVMEWSNGRGADIVYEAVGGTADTLNLSVQMTGAKGTVGVVGSFRTPQTIDTRLALRREMTLAWVWSYALRRERPEFDIALDLLARGLLKAEPLITHRFPLDRIGEGFVAADKKSEYESIKVLVLP
jgi:2-desacetyl-2-hydroxyethyl bacteriochlorophyllide A dehydrogenase